MISALISLTLTIIIQTTLTLSVPNSLESQVGKVHLATNGVTFYAHIIKRENWTPQIFESFNWYSVATAMEKEPDANQVCFVKFSHRWSATQRNTKLYHLSKHSKCPIYEPRTDTHFRLL